MVSCVVQTIKQQTNWRQQSSAPLSLQTCTNRSEVLPQHGFTYMLLGHITDYIVLTVREEKAWKCWNDHTYSLITDFKERYSAFIYKFSVAHS